MHLPPAHALTISYICAPPPLRYWNPPIHYTYPLVRSCIQYTLLFFPRGAGKPAVIATTRGGCALIANFNLSLVESIKPTPHTHTRVCLLCLLNEKELRFVLWVSDGCYVFFFFVVVGFTQRFITILCWNESIFISFTQSRLVFFFFFLLSIISWLFLCVTRYFSLEIYIYAGLINLSAIPLIFSIAQSSLSFSCGVCESGFRLFLFYIFFLVLLLWALIIFLLPVISGGMRTPLRAGICGLCVCMCVCVARRKMFLLREDTSFGFFALVFSNCRYFE